MYAVDLFYMNILFLIYTMSLLAVPVKHTENIHAALLGHFAKLENHIVRVRSVANSIGSS